MKKGTLKSIGYDVNKSDLSRHRAVNKGIKKYGYSKMIKKLNIIAILLKNSSPIKSKIFRKDMKYLQKNRQNI